MLECAPRFWGEDARQLMNKLARFVLLATFFLWVLQPAPVAAHGRGGTDQLRAAAAGPYVVWVWSDPDPLRVGAMHFTIVVAESADQAPSGDVQLTARAAPFAAPDTPLVAMAESRRSIYNFYVVSFAPSISGNWVVNLSIEGATGTGEIGFEVEVLPERDFDWGVVLKIGLAVLPIGGLTWWFLMAPQRKDGIGPGPNTK